MKNTLIPLVSLGLTLASASAGTISLSGPLTTDASTGISTSRTYTHAISGGTAATVNGVNFVALSPLPVVPPANFSWASTGGFNQVLNNPGDWVAVTGGVVGLGLHSATNTGLLDSFTYAGTGAGPGSSQTYTLTGLILGTIYDARLYIRVWDTEGSSRPIALTFTNGAEINPAPASPEDRPSALLGGNDHQAYYVNYRYTALTPSLVITAVVPAGSAADSGSFHLYGLSNQVVPEPCTAVSLALALGLFGSVRRRRA